MAIVQIITAMTLDGFLPYEDEELFKWVKTDKRGFPFWHDRGTFMLPVGYPMLDLICEKDGKDASCVYTAEISDKKSLELLHRLSIYHLIDEIVVYVLPLTYGKGIAVGNCTDPSCSIVASAVLFTVNPRDSPLHPARKSCKMQDSPDLHFLHRNFLFR